jgi:hypothetical protein
MNTRLLKINAMKRFYNWATMTGDHGTVAAFFSWLGIDQIDKIMDRQLAVSERDSWFRKRKNAVVSYDRDPIAYALLNYIKKRKNRKIGKNF